MPAEECVSKCRDVRTTLRISHQAVKDVPEYAASCTADFRIRQRLTLAPGAILHQSPGWDSPYHRLLPSGKPSRRQPHSHCWLFRADYCAKASKLSVRLSPDFIVVFCPYKSRKGISSKLYASARRTESSRTSAGLRPQVMQPARIQIARSRRMPFRSRPKYGAAITRSRKGGQER